jgi:hypothetical protein
MPWTLARPRASVKRYGFAAIQMTSEERFAPPFYEIPELINVSPGLQTRSRSRDQRPPGISKA